MGGHKTRPYTRTIILLTVLMLPLPAFAWVEPTTVPPGNNIFAPLNSSAFGQSKVGGLILNLGNAAHGLIVRYGLVGIGTDNPQAELDVVGKIKSTGLEVTSTTQGVLFPRMTTAQRNAIVSPQLGTIIINTDTKKVNMFDGTNWVLIGGDSTPAGTIAYFDLASCPEGWSEATNAKGRYIVGTQNSANKNLTVGQALSDGENRAVGQHAHGATQVPHDHAYSYLISLGLYSPRINHIWNNNFGYRLPSYRGTLYGYGYEQYTTGSVIANQPAITVNSAGSVGGTNAPYVEFLVCRKN